MRTKTALMGVAGFFTHRKHLLLGLRDSRVADKRQHLNLFGVDESTYQVPHPPFAATEKKNLKLKTKTPSAVNVSKDHQYLTQYSRKVGIEEMVCTRDCHLAAVPRVVIVEFVTMGSMPKETQLQ